MFDISGVCDLPIEIQTHITLDSAMRHAIMQTFNELPTAQYASAVYWYETLICATITQKYYNGIPELCVNLLNEICQEIERRWDPYNAVLSSRFFSLFSFIIVFFSSIFCF